jgi:hypothetical protein
MRRFVSDFLLPVVRGGAAHVSRPLGMSAVERMKDELPLTEGDALAKLAACRVTNAHHVSPLLVPPPLDETSLRLGAALHDLLALGHPGAGRRPVAPRGSRRRGGTRARFGRRPRSASEAVNRHSLLARLPEIVRVDRTVFFWLGRQTFVGRRPPRRVTALPGLRRVRVEQTSRSWLREIGIPVVGRQAFLALNVASPLGEALDPLRLDPPVAWGRILPVLRFPALARVVASQAVSIGVDRSATRWPTRFIASLLSRSAAGIDASPDAVRSRCASSRTWSGSTCCSGVRRKDRIRGHRSFARAGRRSGGDVDGRGAYDAHAGVARGRSRERRSGRRVRGAPRRAREAGPDRRHAQISGSAWYRRAGGRADDQTGLRGWSYGMIHGPCRSANP